MTNNDVGWGRERAKIKTELRSRGYKINNNPGNPGNPRNPKRRMKRYDPHYEEKRGPYAQVRSFEVRGKRGYYRKGYTMKRRGKRIRVKRTYVPPTKKTWRVRSHKKKVWYLPGQVPKRRRRRR